MIKYKLFILVIFFAPFYAESKQIELNEYLLLVDSNNTDSILEKEKIKYAETLSDRVGLFPDPQIQIGREKELIPYANPEGESASTSPNWLLSFVQEWPWPGSRERKKEAVQSIIPVKKYQLNYSQLEKKYVAIEYYIGYVTLNKNILLDEDSLKESHKTLDLLNSRQRQGLSGHSEIFQIQSDIEILNAELLALKNDLEIRKLRMLSLAGISDETIQFKLDPIEKLLNIYKFSATKNYLDISELIFESSLKNRLKILESIRVESKPSLMTQVSFMRDNDGMYMWSAMFGIKIPFSQGVIESNILEQNRLNESSFQIEKSSYDFKKNTALKISDKRIKQARANIDWLENRMLPLLSEHERVLLSDFAQGKSSLSDMINLRKNILNYKIVLAQSYEALFLEYLQREKIYLGIGIDSIDRSSFQPVFKKMNENASTMSAIKNKDKMSSKFEDKKFINSLNSQNTNGMESQEDLETSSNQQGM